MRIRRWAGAVLVIALLTACSRAPTVTTDASGLVVISDRRDEVVHEQVRDAYAAYDLLTESHPDDFGFASPNIDGVTVRVGVVSDGARELLAAFALGRPPAPSLETDGGTEEAQKRELSLRGAAEQAIGLQAASTPVTHSRRETEALRDEVIGWATDARFADAGIWMSEIERSTGMVVLGAEHLTPALASAIVDRYGTDRIVVQLGDRPETEMTAG